MPLITTSDYSKGASDDALYGTEREAKFDFWASRTTSERVAEVSDEVG